MKYSPEKVAEICKHLTLGMSRVDSCVLSDISEETFYAWMRADGPEYHPEFSESVLKAERTFKERNIGLIQRAAIKSWQAAAWLMERKYPQEFAQRVAHSNPDGTPLNLHQAAILIINGAEAANDARPATLPAAGPIPIGSASASAR